MINFSKVSKSFNGETIFKNLNINISKNGLYGFIGPSGCGKSTLLNLIGLMDDDYKGNIKIFNKDLSKLTSQEKANLRSRYISFIFQSPRLIETESLKVNASLVLNKKISSVKLKEDLKKYHLNLSLKTKVSALSGGEKQRFNLALALLKDSSIILGDEVTSGLDENNKKETLKLLKEASKTRIVILVTHDVLLLKQYTDCIYEFKEKTLPEIKKKGRIKFKEVKKTSSLKLRYIFSHGLRLVRHKIFRTLFAIFSSVVALTCLSISLVLTSSMSDAIMNSLANMISENEIVANKKNSSVDNEENIFLDYEDTKNIYDKYHSFCTYQGVYYPNSLINLFPDGNYFYLHLDSKQISLNYYQIDDVINYEYLYERKENFIYTNSFSLQEDEVIISLTRASLARIIKTYGEEYTSDGQLLDLLNVKPLYLSINLDNDNWDYHLSFDLKVVGYDISSETKLYHSDPKWNEYIVESQMQLPVSYDLDKVDYYPWTVKKLNFIGVEEENISNFIDLLLEESNQDYYFSLIKKEAYYYVYFTYSDSKETKIKEIREIVDDNPSLTTFIPGSMNGYYVVDNALISGFCYPFFLSNDYEQINEYIEYNTYSEENLGLYQSTQFVSISNDFLSLSLFDASKDNALKIKTYNSEDETIIGRYPINDKEIIISSSIAKNLGIDDEDFKEKTIFLLGLKDIETLGDEYKNNFEIITLKVVGISKEEGKFIMVNDLWPISFLIINFNRSEKELYPENIIFTYEGSDIKNEIKKLNETYPEYTFSNPYLDYKDQVDETLNYVTLGLNVFSGFCLISSLLMNIMASYLFVSDNKREIGIYSYLGYSKRSIKRMMKFFGYFLSFYSSFLSCLILIIVITIMNSPAMGYSLPFKVSSLIPFLVIIGVSILTGFISSFFSLRKTIKENPLNQLKEN